MMDAVAIEDAKREPADNASDDTGSVEARSLTRTLAIIGDVWTVLLLKEFFSGRHRFQQLQEALRIPRQTLILRLNRLTEHQCLWRKPAARRGGQPEYHLTPKGLDLYPFVLAVWAWHRRFEPSMTFLPRMLIHRSCGEALDPVFRCDVCAEPVDRASVSIAPGPGAGRDPRPAGRMARANDEAIVKACGAGDAALIATSIIGDQWSHLVVAEMMRGTVTFQALTQALAISSNILSARLKKLVALGLIEAQPDAGRRTAYLFTEAGEALFPILQTLAAWGDRWLAGVKGPPELLRHACGAVSHPRLACRHCGLTVRPWDVRPVLDGSLP